MGKNIPRFFMIATLIFALLTVTACNNKPDEVVEEKRTLSISLPSLLPPMQTRIERFKKAYPDVELVIHSYYSDDFEKDLNRITTQLMAGDADDIFSAEQFFETKIFDSGLLADFYPLMKNDPDFNEEDYYMNALKGMEYKGKLFAFPIEFYYSTAGISNRLSEELTKRFERYDVVTSRQMLDLYNALPDKNGLYMSRNTDACIVVYNNLSTFIDFESKTCDFNNADFIKFITDLKSATNPQRKENGELGAFGPSFRWDERGTNALQYLFQYADSTGFSHSVFFPYADKEAFTHFIPVVNENGNLAIDSSDQFYISEASENKELAWKFIKFLTTPEANQGIRMFDFSMNRKTYEICTYSELTESVVSRRMKQAIDGETDEVVNQVMDYFGRYNEMPMEFRKYSFNLRKMITEIMVNFYNDILTAERVASELQNKISLYLME